MPVALRPLNTSLIRATIDTGGKTLSFEGVDADLLASRVFSCIDSMSAEWRPLIAANLVEGLASWTGDAGTDDELEEAKSELVAQLSSSLASAYAGEVPVRRVPPPPRIMLAATPAPLPLAPTVADARLWIFTWQVEVPDPAIDVVHTELSTAPAPPRPAVEATAFERALLAFDVSPDADALERIASTPIDAPLHGFPRPESGASASLATRRAACPALSTGQDAPCVAGGSPAPLGETTLVPNGPASGSVVLDCSESMGIRAVVVRNGEYAEPFVYVTETHSEVLEPAIDRNEEIAAASLGDIASLSPTRVEVWFESRELRTRVPVVLVIDQFDGSLVQQAMDRWSEMTAPPDGEFIFDVTAARLRLKRVVLRPQTAATASTPAA